MSHFLLVGRVVMWSVVMLTYVAPRKRPGLDGSVIRARGKPLHAETFVAISHYFQEQAELIKKL
jgi:hypothetical protein